MARASLSCLPTATFSNLRRRTTPPAPKQDLFSPYPSHDYRVPSGPCMVEVGGVFAKPVYSILSTRTCFSPSVQSCLDPLPTLFGPRLTLLPPSSPPQFREAHYLALATPMKVSMSHPYHAHPYILRRGL
jgi:hypothetical protein